MMEESRFKSGILPKPSHGEVFYIRLEERTTLDRLPAVRRDSFELSEWDELTSGRVFLQYNAIRWPRYASDAR